MSYDIGIKGIRKTKCPHCDKTVSEEEDYIGFASYTYNLGGLFRAVFPCGLQDFYGSKAIVFGAALTVALDGIKAMGDEERTQFNPDNGWGDVASFVEWLESMRDACRENPDFVVTYWLWA